MLSGGRCSYPDPDFCVDLLALHATVQPGSRLKLLLAKQSGSRSRGRRRSVTWLIRSAQFLDVSWIFSVDGMTQFQGKIERIGLPLSLSLDRYFQSISFRSDASSWHRHNNRRPCNRWEKKDQRACSNTLPAKSAVSFRDPLREFLHHHPGLSSGPIS